MQAAANAVVPRYKARLKIGDIVLEAVSAGVWGNDLRARVEGSVPKDVTDRYGLAEGEMFNLLVHDAATGATEKFMNVSVKPGIRRLDKVLENESNLARVVGDLPDDVPEISDKKLNEEAEGADAEKVKKAKEELKISPFKSDQRSVSVAEADAASADSPLDDNDYNGSEANKTGIRALDNTDLFNMLCMPPDTREGDTNEVVYQTAVSYCADRRAMLIVDSPATWKTAAAARDGMRRFTFRVAYSPTRSAKDKLASSFPAASSRA